MLAYTFGLLSFYWVLRSLFCPLSTIRKMGQWILSAFSFVLFLFLPKEFFCPPFLLMCSILALSLRKHIKKRHPPRLSPLLGWSCLYCTGVIIALLSLVFQYQSDQIIGHVILKGHDRSTWMTWKNPSQSAIEGAWIPSYEVEIQDAKGNTLYSDFMIGDFVGVRAQVITIDWPYQFMGFSHLYRLELVHNGYATAQRHQVFPHMAYELPFPAQFFEKLWYRLFTGDWKIPGVKSSSLESSYFPLQEPKLKPSTRQYDLVIGSTGLSSRLSQKKTQSDI